MIFDKVYPKYKNKPIVPTKDAAFELLHISISLEDISEILDKGIECSTGKRKENVCEVGLQRGRYFLKAVVVEKEDRFLLIHVGRLTFSKGLKKKLKSGGKNVG